MQIDNYIREANGPGYEEYEALSTPAFGPRDDREPRIDSTGNRFQISAAKILDFCEESMDVEIAELIRRELDELMYPSDIMRPACNEYYTMDALRCAIRKQMLVCTCDSRSLQRLVRAFDWSTGEKLL